MPGDREEFLYEKSLGSDLSRSPRCKECMGNRSLYEANIRRITLLISVIEIQGSQSP
jgi:hypothetical protein